MVPSASERLAAFAAELRFEMLPADVVAKLKLHLLDVLGVALAGASMEFGGAALGVGTHLGGSPTCTVIGFRERLPAVWAALVNGTLAHGLDYDDTHTESVVHVSASVVPAALAACEETGATGTGATGETLLAALAAGMEANIRIGLVARGGFHDRGFHPTGICGTFASALVAGTVAGLSPAQLADALGLAGSQAAGSLEFLTDGTSAKRLHAGWAAHSGVVAARLAAAGFSGPRGTLDGRFGLYRSHLGDSGWDLAALTDGLGARWELLNIGLKPYPCCHFNHAFIDCAAALRATSMLVPDAIEEIECFISAREVPVVCEPVATKRVPQNEYDAKFSLPYAVASMLVRGHVDVDDFTDAAIHHPQVLALAQRVVYRNDPESDFPRRFPGRVRIRLRNGRSVEHHEPVNRGSAERPLSEDEVCDKFRRNALRVLPREQAEAALAAIASVEQAADLSSLTAALRPK
ncbi:MAG: MmgE/PrpD family protein [Candidatus Binatia bacterium]